MTRHVEFLDPHRKLVDEVVDWLCGTASRPGRMEMTPEGVRSLGHLLVVVPTAQSGRSLRLGLARAAAARGWGGVLPPKIAMPNLLIQAKDVRVATEAEELATLASVLLEADLTDFPDLFPKPPTEKSSDWALDLAQSLLGISSILGERALLMRDVRCAADAARWCDLARIETAFLDRLAAQGVVARAVSRRTAVTAGCTEDGVREIVLPAAVDVTGAFVDYLEHSTQDVSVLIHAAEADADKFDDWGRPVAFFPAALRPDRIRSAPTAVVEADEIARFFRSVDACDALPALAVCDAEMYPELEGAFQNHFSGDELTLRNPSKEMLAKSALGRLLVCILELAQHGDYETFSTFVRMGDVVRWATSRLNATPAEVARYVGALDAVQNAHLPRTIEETVRAAAAESQTAWRESDRAAAAGLIRLAEAVREGLADPYTFLGRIFASLTLDEKNPSDRELVAAAETVRDLRAACASELVPKRLRPALRLKLIKTATYMLEPTATNVLATTGWLEVPWCAEDELVIAGFNEGCVPENVVGHPFVPNSLRAELGLVTNDRRAMRDAFILAEAVACRGPEMVSVHLHQIAGDKNVMKPSRLLFLGIDDADLPDLALRLYAVTKGADGAPPKELPPAWRLSLPVPPRGLVWRKKMSPTALDQYLRCPFAFFLQETFGEHADDRSQELDARTFGNLCHAALDAFAKVGPKDSTDADEIAAFLMDEVGRQLQSFGAVLPAVIELQGEAAVERLRNFAVHQAARRKAGWRIVAAEQKLSCTVKGCPTVLSGKVDRIDEHEVTKELAIIDYKTWNRVDAKSYDSIQLPAYRAMVEASKLYDPAKAHAAKAFYCVLAERAEDVRFDEEHACHEGLQSEAEDRIVALLTGIARGIFYPPGKDSNWKDAYGPLVWESLEKGLDPAWVADQNARKEASA